MTPQGDSLTAIESLIGSAFADMLTGDNGVNTLDGGAGNDVLVGGAGSDVLIGGSGTDTASYTGALSGLIANLANSALNTGDAAGDSYNSIESLIGSALADFLTGDTGVNSLDGGSGDDTLAGGASSDMLTGGAGTDTADYSSSGTGVTAYLDGTAGVGGDAAGDTLFGIEVLTGSNYADILTGDTGANTLHGGVGDDILIGGAGADTLDGGSGIDTASYATAASGVTANLANSLANTGDAAGDGYTSIENLTGSASADTLTGDGNANTLNGGSGNDMLHGGAGADTLIGGAGTDTADYTGSAAINMTLGTTGAGSGGDAAGDTLSGIEKVIGSSNDDGFTLDLSHGWSVDGGAGQDKATLAADTGSVGQGSLLGVLTHVEQIDFTASNVSANLTVDSSFIQSIVGAGNSSHLTLNMNANDSFSFDASAHYTQAGNDYTLYSDAAMTTEVAKLSIAP